MVIGKDEGAVTADTYRTVSSSSSAPASLPFSLLPLPMNKCRGLVWQPSIFMNSSNSSTLLLQQVYPLLPSWKMGIPGWCTQFSLSFRSAPFL